VSGVGKSTVCALLKARQEPAVDADGEGFNHWVDRESGEIVVNPPYPVPAGWIERFAWQISREKVVALRERAPSKTALLFGMVENELEVSDLFDKVICLVADNRTIEARLQTRTTNEFGKHPDQMAAVLGWNSSVEEIYRRSGATIIDGRMDPADVADAVLAAAQVPSREG
jgi:hypothetical protein